jgi:hypothetical protein
MGVYIAALIAAIASIVTALTTAIFTLRSQKRVAEMQTYTQERIAALQAETQTSLARLQDELQQKKEGRLKVEKAEEILAKYREPLVQAAFELQSRLYNIINGDLLQTFYLKGNEIERTYTLENTIFVFAQYLAWTEIIRREVQFLNLGEIESTRQLSNLQNNIRSIMLSSRHGRLCRVFRGEQRAVGELMIVSKGEQNFCMGYAAFVERKEPEFTRWFDPIRKSIDELAGDPSSGRERLRLLQHALVDLIDYLDPCYMRFDKDRCRKA